MSEVKVHLGGEGKNELGSRALPEPYQSGDVPGVVETLLRRVEPEGWTAARATPWKLIRKFSANASMSAEQRNVLGLVEAAARGEIPVVAFVRDADGDSERTKEIEAAIQEASDVFPSVQVIGGTANPVLEAWILAMKGEHGTEKLSKASAQTKLKEQGIDKDTAAMTSVVTDADFGRLPADAESLSRWMERAKQVLPAQVRAGSRGSAQ